MTIAAQAYTLKELTGILPLTRAAIDKLVRDGELKVEKRGRSKAVARSEVEAFLERCLLAVRTPVTDVAPVVSLSIISSATEQPRTEPARPILITAQEPTNKTAPVVEPHVEAPRELRGGGRFLPLTPIAGRFVSGDMEIIQLSATGLRIRHARPFRIGSQGRVVIANAGPHELKGKITWSRLSGGDDAHRYVSGIELTEGAESLARIVESLRAANVVEEERGSLERKREAAAAKRRRTEMLKTTVPQREVEVAILRKRDELRRNPLQAQEWFNRARFALSNEAVRRVVPAAIRDRDEALAIWEALERRVDLRVICAIVTESR